MNLANHILVGAGAGLLIYFFFFNKGKAAVSGSQVLIAGSTGSAAFVVAPGGGLANIGVPFPGSQLADEAAQVYDTFNNSGEY